MNFYLALEIFLKILNIIAVACDILVIGSLCVTH